MKAQIQKTEEKVKNEMKNDIQNKPEVKLSVNDLIKNQKNFMEELIST